MLPQTADVVIIGAGIIGASIAHHLAVRGCTNVVILEKEETEISGSTARSVAGVPLISVSSFSKIGRAHV